MESKGISQLTVSKLPSITSGMFFFFFFLIHIQVNYNSEFTSIYLIKFNFLSQILSYFFQYKVQSLRHPQNTECRNLLMKMKRANKYNIADSPVVGG